VPNTPQSKANQTVCWILKSLVVSYVHILHTNMGDQLPLKLYGRLIVLEATL
jgi:hypothetical protein